MSRARSLRRSLGVSTILVIVLLVMAPAPPAGADSPCWRYRKPEKALRSFTNRTRARRGLSRLEADPELSKVARVHSTDMAQAGHTFHSSRRTLERRVTNWRILGENVGIGRAISEVYRAFMRSSTHRGNILYPSYRRIGVGVVESRGHLWVSVLFATKRNPGTTLRMPRC